MIAPGEQWCAQIDVTNACPRECSNCTRLVGHGPVFYMKIDQFAEAVEAMKDFPEESPPSKAADFKLVGIIGGEPLMHPRFGEILGVLADKIPARRSRGLWTGLEWRRTKHASQIREVFDERGIHNNRHDLKKSLHSPVLVASRDVIRDPIERTAVIEKCWLQQKWSGTITPKGHFFCEVAGALDWVFEGPGGLPVVPGCWARPLVDFQSQVDRWCQQCGIALNLEGRDASEGNDDITTSNLAALRQSPRIQAGRYVLRSSRDCGAIANPWEYLA